MLTCSSLSGPISAYDWYKPDRYQISAQLFVCYCKLKETEKHNKLHSRITTRCCVYHKFQLFVVWLLPWQVQFTSVQNYQPSLRINNRLGSCRLIRWWQPRVATLTSLGCWWRCHRLWRRASRRCMIIWKSILKETNSILKQLFNMFRGCWNHVVFPIRCLSNLFSHVVWPIGFQLWWK